MFGLFLKNNDEVSVRLTYGTGPELLEKLNDGEIDLVVAPDPGKEFGGMSASSYETRPIIEDEMWLVSNLPNMAVTSLESINAFADYPVVWLTEEFPGFEHYVTRELKKSGIILRPIFESANVGTVKRVIEAGAGWGFLPAHSVRKQVRSGRMQKIDIKGFQYPISLKAYYPKNLKSAKVLDVFLRSLQGQLVVG
jgi:DNA-binding transcriptional LysR family regulator